ncbi:MAG: phenylalanine--tRNA ligase subunit beta [Chlamydiales bacterium]
MKLTLSLIQSFIQLALTPIQIGETLTLLGVELDLIEEGDDPVLEFSLTPNLGHCMSALGIARELSAALQIPLQKPAVRRAFGTLKKKVVIQDDSLCPRYMGCLIEGVEVGPSPLWLKQQLELCGQKSVNNAVDAANYIMLKWGQPLHVFDSDLLAGDRIEVSSAKGPLAFVGLDGIEREIPAGTLLISDGEKPVAIAGIMGGENSAVSEKTTRILLEAACFDPISIRAASKKIGVRTESSLRFEKGVDPVGLEEAFFAAAEMIGGKILGVADSKKGPLLPKEIRYRAARINQILGTKLSETEIEEIFVRLGFKAGNGRAEIPLYRTDLSEEIDLVEEVARIYGYNNIEKSVPYCSTSLIPSDPVFLFENEMRRRLAGLGLVEFISCDLMSPKLADISRSITPEAMGFLKAGYSKSEEYSILRTSLLPGLLQSAKRNIDQKNHNISAFEMGRIHFLQEGRAVEIPMAAILLTGKRTLPHWSHKAEDIDYFDLKGIIENLLTAAYHPSEHIAFHPGRQADIHMGDWVVGSLGEVHPSLLEKFGIEERVLYAELHLLHLLKMKKHHLKIAPLSQFPSSERDWTVPLELQIPIDRVFQAIYSFNTPLLERVDLIDLYLPDDAKEKNATFRFIYRDKCKTVSFEEVESEHAKITSGVVKLLAK